MRKTIGKCQLNELAFYKDGNANCQRCMEKMFSIMIGQVNEIKLECQGSSFQCR